jgi:hypothetical protein
MGLNGSLELTDLAMTQDSAGRPTARFRGTRCKSHDHFFLNWGGVFCIFLPYNRWSTWN